MILIEHFALTIGIATMNSVRLTAISYQRLAYKFILRSNATVATQILKENISDQLDADSEWKNAKPFEDMPGLRSFPILGTAWVFLPVIGNSLLLCNYLLETLDKIFFGRRGTEYLSVASMTS